MKKNKNYKEKYSFKMPRRKYSKRKETYEKLRYKILEEKNISMEDYL